MKDQWQVNASRETMAKAAQLKPGRSDAKRLAAAALADLDRARAAMAQLSAGLEGSINGPFNAPSNAAADLSVWRAAHRSGSPSRLDADPELRAFVLSRIATLTYDQIVQAVAASFPPARRISRSSLSRWWRRQNGLQARASIG